MHLVLQPGMPADTLDQKCRPAFPADISCKKVAAENESAPLWTKVAAGIPGRHYKSGGCWVREQASRALFFLVAP